MLAKSCDGLLIYILVDVVLRKDASKDWTWFRTTLRRIGLGSEIYASKTTGLGSEIYSTLHGFWRFKYIVANIIENFCVLLFELVISSNFDIISGKP